MAIQFQVKWDLHLDRYNISCSRCNGSCGYNDTVPSKPFLCFPNLGNLNDQDSHWFTKRRLVVLVSGLVISTLFIAFIVTVYFKKKLSRSRRDSLSLFFNKNHIYPPVFTYDQLRTSTNGFDLRRKIGDGGFGSVYLANFPDGRIAAVKRLHRHHPAATTKSFCNEIMILSSLRHPNLVRLHGYCFDPRGLLLVYDYVPNGTLADHLHGPSSRKGVIGWGVRVDIALQVATALEYLHFWLKPPVVHRDVTSSNIFVEKDMRIKVGDFGLSRLLALPDPNVDTGDSLDEYVCCTGPQGTPGYLDPEYHRSFRLTEKSDVYSFGVVLLELITGMKAVDMKRDKRDVSLADLVVSRIHVGTLHQVVDPLLVRHGEDMASIEAVAELAFRCVAEDKDDRPNARELVVELKRIRGRIQDGTGK